MNQTTLADRAADMVSRLQPFPTAEQMIEAVRAPQLVALPPVVTDDQLRQMAQNSLLRIREANAVLATDEEIAESAATMTPEEAAHVATLPSSFDEDGQPQYIDLTPESLKTPAGAAKVTAAMEAWEATHAEVANLATFFLNRHGDDIADCMEMYGNAFHDDLRELREAMADRDQKQNAFLRALAGN